MTNRIWARIKDCTELSLPGIGILGRITYWAGVCPHYDGRYVMAGSRVGLLGAIMLGEYSIWQGNEWATPWQDAARILDITEADVRALCYGFDGIDRGDYAAEFVAMGRELRGRFLVKKETNDD